MCGRATAPLSCARTGAKPPARPSPAARKNRLVVDLGVWGKLGGWEIDGPNGLSVASGGGSNNTARQCTPCPSHPPPRKPDSLLNDRDQIPAASGNGRRQPPVRRSPGVPRYGLDLRPPPAMGRCRGQWIRQVAFCPGARRERPRRPRRNPVPLPPPGPPPVDAGSGGGPGFLRAAKTPCRGRPIGGQVVQPRGGGSVHRQ